MREKRRDNKNRILHTGESQRKDGRYVYKYADAAGKQQFVYAWKLTPTDKTPAGKRDGLSLREKEQQIQKDLQDNIDPLGAKMTVCQLFEKYTAQRPNVRQSTHLARKTLLHLLQKESLGARSIDSIKPSDATMWVLQMKEKGYAYRSIREFKIYLKAAFQIAIRDDYIRKNPFDFQLNTVISDDTTPKMALTPEQERQLLDFVKQDHVYRKYYDAIVILLGTGLRISEFCGLTVSDLDFENRLITVDHQLLRDKELGYYVNSPKTGNGTRQVPMSEAVYQALKRALPDGSRQEEPCIDGYSGFLFLDRNHRPKTGVQYANMLPKLVKKYNEQHELPLPHITPHILRHTFCTRMAVAGMNPKNLQYLMGHGTISMTLDYYTHISVNTAKEEFDQLTCEEHAS